MENRDEHFNNVDVVSFDVIHRRCRGNPIENSVQNYNTIKDDDFENHPKKKKRKRFLLY